MSSTAWSQSEEALRDTLAHKAERSAFRRITELYSFLWPGGLDEEAWRGALTEVVYNAKDTWPVLFAALRKGLSQFTENVTVTFQPGEPTIAYFPHEVSTAYVGRLIRIDGETYLSTDAVDDELHLSPYRTSYWEAAAFDVDGETEAEAQILPFVTFERQAGPSYVDPYLTGNPADSWGGATYSWSNNNTVEVEVWPHIGSIPETYLLEPTEYLTATPGTCPADGGDVCTPEDMPNGGYLLEDDTEDLEDDVEVAYPVYLADGEVAREVESQFDRLLCAGNHLEIRATSRTWISF